MKQIVKALGIISLIVIIGACMAGCGGKTGSSTADKEIKVGVTSGPHAEIMDQVAKEAEKQGIKIKVVEFSDYVQPNQALADGDLEMNSFQVQTYLDNTIKKHGFKLVPIGKTILLPMAVYSEKYKSIDDLPQHAKITIPNDPTNEARALLLLQSANLITLADPDSVNSNVNDVVENKKDLQFIELDAAQTSRSMGDADAAVINANYAIEAGLNPLTGAIFTENTSSKYVNLIVVREEDKDNPTYQKIVKIYESDPIKQYINEHFKGTIIPGW